MIQEIKIVITTPTKEDIEISKSIGLLNSEIDIVRYRYKKKIEAIINTDGYRKKHLMPKGVYIPIMNDYNGSNLKGVTPEEYVKTYPIRFNNELGIYTNV